MKGEWELEGGGRWDGVVTGTAAWEGREAIAIVPMELGLIGGGCCSQEIHPCLRGIVYSRVLRETVKHFIVLPMYFYYIVQV